MRRFWHHFVSNGRGGVPCAPLGFVGHATPVLRSLAARLGLRQRAGVEVWDCRPGSALARSGVQPDDVLVSLAGRPVTSIAHIAAVLRSVAGLAAVPVIFLRGDERLERSLELPPGVRRG